MWWLFLGVIYILFAATAVVVWQKWIAPWRQIEPLVRQIAGGERPRTFLVDGGPEPQRVGLVLENIFARQEELGRQMAGLSLSARIRVETSTSGCVQWVRVNQFK